MFYRTLKLLCNFVCLLQIKHCIFKNHLVDLIFLKGFTFKMALEKCFRNSDSKRCIVFQTLLFCFRSCQSIYVDTLLELCVEKPPWFFVSEELAGSSLFPREFPHLQLYLGSLHLEADPANTDVYCKVQMTIVLINAAYEISQYKKNHCRFISNTVHNGIL